MRVFLKDDQFDELDINVFLALSFADMASRCRSNIIHHHIPGFRSNLQCCMYRVFRTSQSLLGYAAFSSLSPVLGDSDSQLYFSIHSAVNMKFLALVGPMNRSEM